MTWFLERAAMIVTSRISWFVDGLSRGFWLLLGICHIFG